MGASTITNVQPRIYVACLAAYNNGILHGTWMDAAREPQALQDDVRYMLATSPIAGAREWAIHDNEGFGSLRIEEYTGLDRISELGSFIAEHDELGAALLDHFSGDMDEAQEAIDDRYMGSYASLADYMQELTEQTISIPHALRYYIDYEAMAHDAELNGDAFTVRTAWDAVHVFAGC